MDEDRNRETLSRGQEQRHPTGDRDRDRGILPRGQGQRHTTGDRDRDRDTPDILMK